MGIKHWSYFNPLALCCSKDMDPAAIIARAKMQAAQILHDAEQKAKTLSDSKQLAKKPSDEFKTPDRPTCSIVSPVSGSSSKQAKQYGLLKFFGTAKQKEEASPILAEKEIKVSSRITNSKAMKELMEKKAEYEKLLEAQELENAVDEKNESIKKHRARAGRPAYTDARYTLNSNSNRRKEGACRRKVEFGAYEKMKICDDIEKQKESFSKEDELWSHVRKVYGITVQRLKDIFSKRQQWINLVKSNNLGANKGAKKGKKKRAKNAKVRCAGAFAGRQRKCLSYFLPWRPQSGNFLCTREPCRQPTPKN